MSEPTHRAPCTHLSAATLWLSILAAGLSAQSGASGSETSHSSARALAAGGGPASSTSYAVETDLALPAGAPVASSASYSFEGGPVLTGPGLAPPGPIVFGVADPRGHKDGGVAETIVGRGFQAPGAGAASASFAGLLASGVAVIDDARLSVLTPPGVNGYGNALPSVDVAVTNLLGTSAAAGAYAYTPALLASEPPRIGKTFRLTLLGEPGALQDLYYGISIPGFALPIPPITGSWELLALYVSPVPAAFAPTGDTAWPLPIPNDPQLVGATLEWQGFSLSALVPLTGAFTNKVVTVIEGPTP